MEASRSHTDQEKIRTLIELTGCDEARALALLSACSGDVQAAVAMHFDSAAGDTAAAIARDAGRTAAALQRDRAALYPSNPDSVQPSEHHDAEWLKYEQRNPPVDSATQRLARAASAGFDPYMIDGKKPNSSQWEANYNSKGRQCAVQ